MLGRLMIIFVYIVSTSLLASVIQNMMGVIISGPSVNRIVYGVVVLLIGAGLYVVVKVTGGMEECQKLS